MTEKMSRRGLLGGGMSGLLVMSLSGCSASDSTQNGKRKPHYVLVFDQTKCVGCGLCKEACNKTNKLPQGVSRLILENQPDERNRRKYVRVSCQQCANAPCVRVCPTGAAYRDEKTGIVTMDGSKCVGCKYCIAACPYNARFINPQTREAENCDFCLHTRLAKGELPACVAACRHGALHFGDANDPDSFVSRLLAVKDAVRVMPELGTEPSLRYIPITKPRI